jgi:hypothetical protein
MAKCGMVYLQRGGSFIRTNMNHSRFEKSLSLYTFDFRSMVTSSTRSRTIIPGQRNSVQC